MNSSTQIESQQDDFATLTEARAKVEALRVWAFKELDRAMIGSIANDVLESLHHELENRAASLGCACRDRGRARRDGRRDGRTQTGLLPQPGRGEDGGVTKRIPKQPPVGITGAHIWNDGTHVLLDLEIDGEWVRVISEYAPCETAFGHIVEPAGIRAAARAHTAKGEQT